MSDILDVPRLSPSMPILVVNDYPVMARIIANLLRQIGFTVVDEIYDGCGVLQKLGEKNYALIIADTNLAPYSGLELFHKVRAEPGYKDAPFILVSTESKSDQVVAARRAGVSGYLMKPLSAQMLRTKIEAIFTPRAA